MRFGKVVGVQQRTDRVDVLIVDEENGNEEAVVSLCRNNKSMGVRPKDTILDWEAGHPVAVWSSHGLEVHGIELPLHKTRWDGTYVCQCRPLPDGQGGPSCSLEKS